MGQRVVKCAKGTNEGDKGVQSMQEVQTMGQRVVKCAKGTNEGYKRVQSMQEVEIMVARGCNTCKRCKLWGGQGVQRV